MFIVLGRTGIMNAEVKKQRRGTVGMDGKNKGKVREVKAWKFWEGLKE